MITPLPTAATPYASTLREPNSPAMIEGNPKIPAPTTELMTSAARLQRPMARTSPVCEEEPKGWGRLTQVIFVPFEVRNTSGLTSRLDVRRGVNLRAAFPHLLRRYFRITGTRAGVANGHDGPAR